MRPKAIIKINPNIFQNRTAEDSEEAIQAFIDNGKVENTEKSRQQWGNKFIDHLNSRKLNLKQMVHLEKLDEELTRFYYSIKKRNGNPYQISSLRSSLGPLSQFLSENIPNLGGKRIKIHSDDAFSRTRKLIEALFKEGAKEGRDVGLNKSVLTDEQEMQIIQSFDINDPTGLLTKALYIVSKYGLLRGQGCQGFLLSYVSELPMNSLMQRSFQFTLPVEKNNQRGLSYKGGDRIFTIPYNCVDDNNTFALYLSKRPAGYSTLDLFLKPAAKVQAQSHGYWYVDRPASKVQTTKFMQAVAKQLDLDKGSGSGITGHSIRATAITQLARKGIQDSQIIQVSGHKVATKKKQFASLHGFACRLLSSL